MMCFARTLFSTNDTHDKLVRPGSVFFSRTFFFHHAEKAVTNPITNKITESSKRTGFTLFSAFANCDLSRDPNNFSNNKSRVFPQCKLTPWIKLIMERNEGLSGTRKVLFRCWWDVRFGPTISVAVKNIDWKGCFTGFAASEKLSTASWLMPCISYTCFKHISSDKQTRLPFFRFNFFNVPSENPLTILNRVVLAFQTFGLRKVRLSQTFTHNYKIIQ